MARIAKAAKGKANATMWGRAMLPKQNVAGAKDDTTGTCSPASQTRIADEARAKPTPKRHFCRSTHSVTTPEATIAKRRRSTGLKVVCVNVGENSMVG